VDGQWLHDPFAPVASNGIGGVNNVLDFSTEIQLELIPEEEFYV
jgi:hypothetical protein